LQRYLLKKIMDSYLQNLIEKTVEKTVKKVEKKKKQDVEEIVDLDGSVLGSKIPLDVNVKNVTAKNTTDATVDMARQPPTTGEKFNGPRTSQRYWGESDMSATLGYDETMGKDLDYDKAKKYFMKDLGFDEAEAEERLEKLGYVKRSNDKVRLIEKNQFLESIIDDAIQNQGQKKRLNPIVLRQLMSLKQTLRANNLTLQDIIPYLNGE
jgi:hypothetical protein